MKTLVVVRHAKSSWDNPSLRDFERPLNNRGSRDAPVMGKRLADLGMTPELMLSSPANRAITTCRIFATELGYEQTRIQTNDNLYHADAETMLAVVRMIPDSIGTAFLFGHNPGLTDFIDELTDELIDNIPTTGIAVCELNVSNWEKSKWGCANLKLFDYPKKIH